MSKGLRTVVLAIAMLIASMALSRIFVTQTAQAQRANAKWEYLLIQGSPKEIVDKANGLAEQGWEVMAVLPYDERFGGLLAYLKRSKP